MKGLTAGCIVKQLPDEMLMASMESATAENPANAPVQLFYGCGQTPVIEPCRLAVLTSKYWGSAGVKLTVSFMDNPNQSTRRKILQYANEWGKYANVAFMETRCAGDVRIARANDGYWSYLGTDVRLIPKNQPTMNLDGFTERTADREYSRVVVHEFGHTLGFPHEHSRKAIVEALDPQKTVAYFRRWQGWSEEMVRSQILTPISERSLLGSPIPEKGSVMCYDFAGECTKDGKPIIGGKAMTTTDKAVVAGLYPRKVKAQRRRAA